MKMINLNYSVLLFTLMLMISCTGNEIKKPIGDSESNVDTNEKEQEEVEPKEEFLVEKDLGDGQKSMKGILSSVGETGQEPMEYNVNLSNGKAENEGLKYEYFELWIEGDAFPEVRTWKADYQLEKGVFDEFKNAIVEIEYTVDKRLRAVDVLAADQKPQDLEEGLLLQKGTLKEVYEHGDGPGSLVLSPAKGGEDQVYEGDYEVEMEAEHQAMKGQKVILIYKEIEQKMYKSGKVVGKLQ